MRNSTAIITLAVGLFSSAAAAFIEPGHEPMALLLVSLRSRELLTGKLVGLGGLTLVQYAVWIAVGLVAGVASGLGISALLMRMASATVPQWQVITSIGPLAATGVGVVLLMAWLFRARTLLSGEPLSAGRLWSALTS